MSAINERGLLCVYTYLCIFLFAGVEVRTAVVLNKDNAIEK